MDRKPETMEEARRRYFDQIAKDKKANKKRLIYFIKSLRIKSVLLLALFLVLAFSFVRSNFMFTKTEYEFTSPYLPNAFNDFKIVQISDLHGKSYGKGGDKLLEAIEELEPDIVVITGDLISRGEMDVDKTIKMIEPISEKYPCYYIRGNHEMFRDENIDNQADFYKSLQEIGVINAENRTIPLYKRQSRIDLVGLREDYKEYKSYEPMDLKKYLGEKGQYFTLLLAHNALKFKDYVNWGADLILSGHVHGGVIRLPFIGGVFSPDRSLFPKYDKGIYKEGQTSMIVSTGLGPARIPFRLFNRPELVVIKLKSQSIR